MSVGLLWRRNSCRLKHNAWWDICLGSRPARSYSIVSDALWDTMRMTEPATERTESTSVVTTRWFGVEFFDCFFVGQRSMQLDSFCLQFEAARSMNWINFSCESKQPQRAGFVSSEADFASIAGRSEKSQPRMTLHLHSIYNNHAKWASSCKTSADINAQSNPNQLLITWRWPRWPVRPLGGNEPSGSILNIAEAQSNSPSISTLVYAADHWRHSFKVLDEAKKTLYEMWGWNKTVF